MKRRDYLAVIGGVLVSGCSRGIGAPYETTEVGNPEYANGRETTEPLLLEIRNTAASARPIEVAVNQDTGDYMTRVSHETSELPADAVVRLRFSIPDSYLVDLRAIEAGATGHVMIDETDFPSPSPENQMISPLTGPLERSVTASADGCSDSGSAGATNHT